MKKVLLASFAIIFFFSCNPDCYDDFHEGKNCDVEVREKYVGTYSGILYWESYWENDNQYSNIEIEMFLLDNASKLTMYNNGIIKFERIVLTLTDNKKKFDINYSDSDGEEIVTGKGFFSDTELKFNATKKLYGPMGTYYKDYNFSGTKQ